MLWAACRKGLWGLNFKTSDSERIAVCFEELNLDGAVAMRMSDLDFELPGELIATRPVEPRDGCRLLVVEGARGALGGGGMGVEDRRFFEIGAFLRAGDLLVVNDTRVLPAKLVLRRKSGAVISGLFLGEVERGEWRVMLRTRGKVSEGEELVGGAFYFLLERREGEGIWRVQVKGAGEVPRAAEVLGLIGHVPLPPYIERARKGMGGEGEVAEDAGWYQTVFARGAGEGRSVAAPTAGLHFTPELLGRLEGAGVRRAAVELEVGMGTFLPVESETLEGHRMHTERYRVPAGTVEAIRLARREGRRIVAVGTTAVRTLEAAAGRILGEDLSADSGTPPVDIVGETDLKIGPGFEFRLTDGLVTNFHLPRSTLMALVAAFLGEGGVERLKGVYAGAIGKGYRFYSYGDAMLILR